MVTSNGLISQILYSMFVTWWRHQMETFSALLALCAGNSPVTGVFPWIPLTKASDAELWCFLWSVIEQTAEQTFETRWRSLWRHCKEKLLGKRTASTTPYSDGKYPNYSQHNIIYVFSLASTQKKGWRYSRNETGSDIKCGTSQRGSPVFVCCT